MAAAALPTGAAAAELPTGWRRAWIGLGANLGDARATLEAACAALAMLPQSRWVARSSWYGSAPVDATGPTFLNAVAVLDSGLEPLALLDALQAIELAHGRERPYRNAPRTLDLDLLLYGAAPLDQPRLQLPHPRLHQRAFVLAPLVELEPALQLAQGPVAALLDAITDQPIRRLPA
ncbi:MAG: 2-amino-4-hydroxy-6-hydroxymethyldihydropteridine diphosphokinase [Pseudomonadota bacterium]|jgi:2-amino-4-hydroxy-6-hydroxymethyldihydropteridine diphosphokinase